MEHLFSPCTHLYDLLESQGRLESFRTRRELLQEQSMDVSTKELLNAETGFTYADLYAMVGNENAVVWLTPHAAGMPVDGIGIRPWMQMNGSCRFFFKADGKELFVLALSPEHLSEICDILLRILAASVVHSVRLGNWDSRHGLLINAPTLAYLMERCQSLKVLTLFGFECLDENHCRVLGAYSRPDLEINLDCCKFTGARTSALAEVLGRNQGPTSLNWCRIDYSILADGLRGNSHLKVLRPRLLSDSLEEDKRQVLAIASALRENKGLVELNMNDGGCKCDETWYAVCDSLKTHPTLQVLRLSPVNNNTWTVPAVITSRIQALLDMMEMNMSINTIHLHDIYSDRELFRGSVIPYLETNQFRPRLLTIQKTRPFLYRAKVLGRALLATRTNPNRLWMLLSGNTEVAFRSRTTTIAVAASIPTSATAAAMTNAAAAVTAASAKLGFTNSATASSLPSAATPSAQALSLLLLLLFGLYFCFCSECCDTFYWSDA
jgi:hypothetical protein